MSLFEQVIDGYINAPARQAAEDALVDAVDDLADLVAENAAALDVEPIVLLERCAAELKARAA